MPWIMLKMQVRAYPTNDDTIDIIEPIYQEIEVRYDETDADKLRVWSELLDKGIKTIPPQVVSDVIYDFLIALYDEHRIKSLRHYNYKALFKDHKVFVFSVTPVSIRYVTIQ